MNTYEFFVAHAFTRELGDDLREAVDRAFEETLFNPYYADHDFSQDYLLEKIKDKIFHTEFGLYDLSPPINPNVMLELGIAIAAGKPRYVLYKGRGPIPTNVAGLNLVPYNSFKNLRETLKNKVIRIELERLNIKKEMDHLSEEVVLRDALKIYQAEELKHGFGVKVSDDDCVNGLAWHGSSVVPPPVHLVYGPYEGLPLPGRYKAVFKLKTDNIATLNEIAQIDAYSNSNGNLNSYRCILGSHFDSPNLYQLFSVKFEYNGEKDLEYRVIKLSRSNQIWIDYIAIIK